MIGSAVRHALLLALSAALSWWLLLGWPPRPSLPQAPDEAPASVALLPLLLAPVADVAPEPEPAPEPTPELEPAPEPEAPEPPRPDPVVAAATTPDPQPPVEAPAEPEPELEPEEPGASTHDETPPPPELGAPEGELEPGGSAAPDEPTVAEQVGALMRDEELLDEARAELAGERTHGFATVLVAAPEEQVEIARFFGEELVLVPRSTLDPDAARPRYFRLGVDGDAQVEAVAGRPPLERYRQYRDLFDYEYGRLPESLRSLRRSVLARSEVYLFAALIPTSEWAVVVARRREALRDADAELGDVRRFVLRYVRAEDGAFDLRVEEIVFADGSRYRPQA